MNSLKTKIFWKLFLPYLITFSAVSIFIVSIFHFYARPFLRSKVKDSLQIEAVSLESMGVDFLEGQSKGAIKDRFYKISQITGTRITLLDRRGEVLVDTWHDISLMDNHLKRPEVVEAMSQEYGFSERLSNTNQSAMFYLARSLGGLSNPKGFIRTSIEIEHAEDQLAIIRNFVTFVAVLGSLGGLFFGFLRSQSLTKRINEMSRSCERIGKGDFKANLSRSQPKDELGKLAAIIETLGSDILHRINTISVERAQLKTILSSLVEGVVSVDHQNRLQFCNSAAYRLLKSDIIDGRNIAIEDLLGFNLLQPLINRSKKSSNLEHEEIVIKEDGSDRILECYAAVINLEGQSETIVVLHDVTKLRYLERVRRDFVANASHEIKTPLTNIKGYAETLLAGAVSDEKNAVRFINKIDSNATRLKSLVQDLLSLARVESADHEDVLVKTSWHATIQQVIPQYEDIVQQKSLTVEYDSSSTDHQITANPEMMLQVFENLYSNAIRYTPEGGVIKVSLESVDGFGVLHVEDSGIGISKKNLERIFERFYRVDKARSRELGGTGLGLSIVKHLVANMNGRIFVTSEVGMGSKFSVALKEPF